MMDWPFLLLLLAIAATWLAWRRAQRESALARARAEALEEPRWRYRLAEAPAARGLGAGYDVLAPDGTRIPDDALEWDGHGLKVIDVHADTAAGSALLDPAFDAGGGVIFVRAGTGMEAWDEAQAVRAGRLAGPDAERVGRMLDSGDLSDCVVLREAPRDGAGPLRLLLVHRDTDVEV